MNTLLETGRLARAAEPYIRFILKRERDEALRDISEPEPDMDALRVRMAACRVFESWLNSDLKRGEDAAKHKTGDYL